MTEIPPGFSLLQPMDEVMGSFAPVYLRQDTDGQVAIGFHVDVQHCNPLGVCHGGTWSTMADIVMGMNVRLVTGMGGPTVSLSLDFLGAGKIGQWIQGQAEILRWTPNLGFAQCRFTADGETVLRANAIFRRKYPASYDFKAAVPQPEG